MSDDSSEPFGTKDVDKNEPCKSTHHVYHCEVSDDASGEAQSSYALPDLNLDLSVAIPSESRTTSEKNLKSFRQSYSSRKLPYDSPSTLLLFQ